MFVILAAISISLLVWLIVSSRPKVPVHRLRPWQTQKDSKKRNEKATVLSATAAATVEALQKAMTGRETRFSETLVLASLRMKPANFMLWMIIVTILSGSAGYLTFGLVGAVVSALIGIAAMFSFLAFRTRRRRQRFAAQMTETLQTLSGALRAGQSLPAAIHMVADESDSPTREEFVRVINEVRIGATMYDALQAVANRTRSEDMLWIVRAIGISSDVGGSLSDVIEGVVQTIQARTELRATIKTVSAEGKLSAYTLGALPFVVATAVSVLSPGYLTPLFNDPIGWGVLSGATVMFVAAVLWMRSIVNVKY